MSKVSVCMATYNGDRFIGHQLESILVQLASSDEIIISDDSSSDKTLDIIAAFNDSRITILENNKFKSPIFNLENALNHVTGTVVFLSDQDDIWLPSKVKVMSECLTNYDLVVSDASLIDASGCVVEDSYFKLRNSSPGLIRNLYRNSYLGCCMAFSRKILDKSLPFPADIPMHDMWIGMIAEIFGRTFFCKQKLVYYRRHSSNASPTAIGKSCYSAFDMVKFRYNLLASLVQRCLLDK